MEIIVTVLMAILLAAQIALSVKQIKKGAPDGKILLRINPIVLSVWTPLSILRFFNIHKAITAVWFGITAVYMLFTIWYTNSLSKTFK